MLSELLLAWGGNIPMRLRWVLVPEKIVKVATLLLSAILLVLTVKETVVLLSGIVLAQAGKAQIPLLSGITLDIVYKVRVLLLLD